MTVPCCPRRLGCRLVLRLLGVSGALATPSPATAAPEPPLAPAPTWSPGHEITSRPRAAGRTSPRDPGEDGAQGRLEGDADLGFGAGAAVRGENLFAAAKLSLHYFWTAGVFASYGESLPAHGSAARFLGYGVDLRPLFLPRWSHNLSRGPALLDLTLDSLSLACGGFWEDRRESPNRHGLEVGLGVGIPLLGRPRGLWLEARGGLSWYDVVPFSAAAPSGTIFLSWHELLETPLVRDPRD